MRLFHKHKYNQAAGTLKFIGDKMDENGTRLYFYQNSCIICGKRKRIVDNCDEIIKWRKKYEK